MLQALDDHQSEISDLSDDNAHDETFEPEDSQSEDTAEPSSAEESDSDDQPLSSYAVHAPGWKVMDFQPILEDFQGSDDDAESRLEWKVMDYVKQYIDEKLLDTISTCTNISSVARTGKNINTTSAEIQRFFGMSVMMSCVGYHRIRMYWQKAFSLPLVAECMTRDRYFRIRSSLKVVVDTDISDDTKKNDRLWKLRPLIDRVHDGCLKQTRPPAVSIDEQMIPFSGACSLRQYVPNKPNPVGLKNFVCASQQGLVLDFVVYQGANSFAAVPPDSNLGVGGSVVAHLVETLPVGTKIYCDRFFMTTSLVDYLLSKDKYITGTVIKNRIPKDAAKLSDEKSLMKRGRGASECVVRGDVSVVKWYDNKPVVMMSTVHGIQPQDICRRWSKKEKKYVNVDRPAVIQQYNLLMGGVDLSDRMMSYYRMDARTCKWTVRTIFHFVDLAIVNAWIGYRQDEIKKGTPQKDILQLMNFRLEVAQTYIAVAEEDSAEECDESDDEAAGSASTSRRRRRVVPVPAPALRRSGSKHLPEMTAFHHGMRCRNTGCTGKTKVRCVACRIFLCMTAERNCFLSYHTKP